MRVVVAVVDVADGGPSDALHLELSSAPAGTGVRYETLLRNDLDGPVRLDGVRFQLDARPTQVLEHGWQSWSTVRRAAVSDLRPVRAEAPAWFRAEMLANSAAPGRVLSGDTFLVTDAGVAGFLAGRHQFGTIEVKPDGAVEARLLLDGVVLQSGATLELEPLWCTDAPAGPAYTEFVELSASEATASGSPPRASSRALLGWCSWYQYWNWVRPDDIRANLAFAIEFAIDLVQIDDGWQRSIGEWTETNDDWGEPISKLAEEISAAGCTPGLWTAPFIVLEGGAVATAHPDWLARDDLGRALRAQPNPLWGGWTSALDTTNPEVLEHLRATYRTLREAGFSYHKIDFCFAAALPGQRVGDGTMTRAEALRAGLEAVREGLGDDAFLLACGCPLSPALGVVDAMRVSEDVAPYWDTRAFFEGFEESSVSARNAIEASVLRVPLHRRWWINDPDCLLLRPSDTQLTDDEREALTMAILGAGAFVVVSDELRGYGTAEWEVLAQLERWRRDADQPRDLRDPFATPVMVAGVPDLWIDWDARTATIGLSEEAWEAGRGASAGDASA